MRHERGGIDIRLYCGIDSNTLGGRGRIPFKYWKMLLGMLEFLLFHESTEGMKDVSFMYGYEGYGNERKFLWVFLLFEG